MANDRRFDNQREPSEFAEEIVQINRVSKKTKGGNKIGFAALAVVGNKKGKVGVGLGKAADVASAIRKGVSVAKKHLIDVPLVNDTIPFGIKIKLGAAEVMLKPAPRGSGVIAGGAVRSVVSAAGVQNISSKVLGTGNQASNVYATIEALKRVAFMHKKFLTTRALKRGK
jgi:small subunit ribosomal protein S5